MTQQEFDKAVAEITLLHVGRVDVVKEKTMQFSVDMLHIFMLRDANVIAEKANSIELERLYEYKKQGATMMGILNVLSIKK